MKQMSQINKILISRQLINVYLACQHSEARIGLHFNSNLVSKYLQTVGPNRTESECTDANRCHFVGFMWQMLNRTQASLLSRSKFTWTTE